MQSSYVRIPTAVQANLHWLKMNSSDSSEDENFDPEEIISRDFEAEKKLIVSNLLPNKSRASYELAYARFLKWKDENSAKTVNEDVLIVYFEELSKKWKPTTLWSHWSKLRTTLNLRHNVNINHFQHLKSFMKNNSKGYKAKKSLVLTWSQAKEFLKSDDNIYLALKVLSEYHLLLIRLLQYSSIYYIYVFFL